MSAKIRFWEGVRHKAAFRFKLWTVSLAVSMVTAVVAPSPLDVPAIFFVAVCASAATSFWRDAYVAESTLEDLRG